MLREAAFFELMSDLDGRQARAFADMAEDLRSVGALPLRRRRGSNVSPPTAAGVLLLAALPGTDDAIRTVDVYGSLVPEWRGGKGARIEVLQDMASRRQFDEALIVLLRRAPELKADLLVMMRNDHPGVPDGALFGVSQMMLEVSVTAPLPSARIALTSIRDGVIFQADWRMDEAKAVEGFYREEIAAGAADKHVRHTVTHRTIFALAELLGQAEDVTEAA